MRVPGTGVLRGGASRLECAPEALVFRNGRLRGSGAEDGMGISDRIVNDAVSRTAPASDFRVPPQLLPNLARVADVAVVGLVGIVAVLADPAEGVEALARQQVATAFFAFAYVFLAGQRGLYAVPALMRPVSRMDDMLIATIGAAALVLGVVFAFGLGAAFPALWLGALASAAFVAVASARLGLRVLLGALARRRVIGSSLVVLGSGEQARRFLERLRQAAPYFTTVTGVFCPDRPDNRDVVGGQPVLGGLDDLLAHARVRKIDDVVVAMPWTADRAVAEAVDRLKELPINVYLSTDLIGYELAFRPAPGGVTEMPLFEVVPRPISGWSSALKAIEDYVLASLALVAISPLLLMIAIAIKIDSPGPVFFMQKRLGFNNKPFSIYKFRSMYHLAAPEAVVRQAQKGDPRVTRVGRFIRSTSLDELPQLLNVLNGTMSLVGPRPHALSHNEEYGRRIRGYFARHRVKPGITGWAQVKGLRGETEALELMEERVRHDVYYADNWSLFLDLRILVMTVVVVFFQKTAY
jgi:Undecaprenyl-phosphate glucose phosphotransferase